MNRRAVFALGVGLAGCGLSVVGEAVTTEPTPVADAGPDSATHLPPPDQGDDDDAAVDAGVDAFVEASIDAGPLGTPAPVVTLATDDVARAVWVDSGKLYYAVTGTTNKIFQSNLDGTNPSGPILQPSDGISGLLQFAVFGDLFWHTGAPNLRKKTIGGPSDDNISASGFAGCVSGDPDGHTLYAAEYGTDAIYQFQQTDNGLPTALLMKAQGVSKPWGVAATTDTLFYTNGTTNEIYERAKVESGVGTKIASDQPGPQCLSIIDGQIYWANFGTGVPTAPLTGDIRRMNLDGTNQQTLVSNLTFPTQVASDGTYLYWNDGKRIMRAVRN